MIHHKWTPQKRQLSVVWCGECLLLLLLWPYCCHHRKNALVSALLHQTRHGWNLFSTKIRPTKHITQSSGFNLHITSYIVGIYLVFIICFVFFRNIFFSFIEKWKKIGQWALDVHLKFSKNKTHQKCQHSWSSITRDPLNRIWGIE